MYDVMHVRPGLLLLLGLYCSFIVYKNGLCSNSLVYCLIAPYRELGFMSIHSLLSRRSYIQYCATQFHHSSPLAHWMLGSDFTAWSSLMALNMEWVTSRVQAFVLFLLFAIRDMFAFVFVVYQTAASLSQRAGGWGWGSGGKQEGGSGRVFLCEQELCVVPTSVPKLHVSTGPCRDWKYIKHATDDVFKVCGAI